MSQLGRPTGWGSLRATWWIWVSLPLPVPPPSLSHYIPPSRPFSLLTDWLHFAADTRHPDFAPALEESVQRTVSLTHSPEDERSCGGEQRLLSISPAAQHLPHCLCGPVGRPAARPAGQSPEGPGAGPDAAGREEEVFIPAQTRRHAGQLHRWDKKKIKNKIK